MKLRTPHLASIVALSLLAAACGGDDSDAATESSTTSTTATTTSTTVASTTTSTTTTSTTTTEAPRPTLDLRLDGLPELAGPAAYEAWLVVGGEPVSVGTFTGPTAGLVIPDDVDEATDVVITIESDDDPAPSATRVLAGPLVDGRADLTVAAPQALGLDFADAAGDYILATPTDGTGPAANERSGVWWTFIPRSQSLFVPALPAGWIYEGWQIIDGVPVTTGTFTQPFGSIDDAAPFSGPEPGPPLVGEDFLVNAPAGLTFPVDLRGSEVAISVEPVPDTGPEPFPIIPLRGTVPADAEDHVAYPVANQTAGLPTGVAEISGG